MGNSILAQCSNGISETQEHHRLPTVQSYGSLHTNRKTQTSTSQQEFLRKVLPYIRRSPQSDAVYKQLQRQKPIFYSIQSKETLDVHNVKSLREFFEREISSQRFTFGQEGLENLKNKEMAQSQFSFGNNSILSLDMTPELSQTNEEEFQQKIKIFKFYLKPATQRQSTFSNDFEKNIQRNRTSSGNYSDFNFKDDFTFAQSPDSIIQLDTFAIFRKEYVYVGYVNAFGKPHGPGQLYHVDETQDLPFVSIFIEAEFVNGSISSQDMVIIFKDSSFYRGGFQEGAFHGKGHLKLLQNIELTGNFVYGFLQGKGRAVYLDGGTYEGNFKAGMKQGKGKMVWKSQKIINNQSPLEICFDGFFKNDKMDGLGYLKTPNYEYWGPFWNNMKQGKGTIKFKNGNKFEGWFQKDEINGYGQLHYANGEVEKGIFPIQKQDPNPISEKQSR